ncbi:MAG TPA: AtpZ/AtpI family protein [Bryobacteraceae bacterium]|jgi:F0F1-type ATP synthase assembly protein I|nr:AtpZ/AtpI family protein [Bryobacteraceae bacterium]
MDQGSGSDLGKYLNLALVLPISALVGFLLGYGLDKLFHTSWIQYVFLVLGVVAGFVETFRVLTGDPKK